MHDHKITIIVYLVMLIGVAVYFIPSWIALNRTPRWFPKLLLFNIFLGWTVIGWIISIYWAFYEETTQEKHER